MKTVIIKSGSKAEKFLNDAIAEKQAFKDAVKNGTIVEYARKRGTQFSKPLSLNSDWKRQ